MKDEIFIDNLVKKYNLSPLEMIMFLYDNARLASKETDECNALFSVLLYKYGIRSYTHWRHGDNRLSHLLHAIYIKDDKYNVDGVYFFDLDWSMDGFKEVTNYKFMAKPIDYFADLDKKIGLVDYDISEFSTVTDNFLDIAFCCGYNELSNTDIDIINKVSEIIDGKSINLPSTNKKDFFAYDKKDEKIGSTIVTEEDLNSLTELEPFTYDQLESIYKTLNNYDMLLNKKIYGETFINLLFNVLKIKYLEGESVDFSTDYIKNIFYLSNWDFSHNIEKMFLTQEFNPEYKEITPFTVADRLNINIDFDENNSYYEPIDINQIDYIFDEVEKEIAMRNIEKYFDLIKLDERIAKVKSDNKSKVKLKENLRVI